MDHRVHEAIALIKANIEQEVPVEKLAAHVSLSPSRFRHIFKAETHTTVGRYLDALRLEEAKNLLENTFLSVKQIRVRVGFTHENQFFRHFKRAYGMSPARHRALHAHKAAQNGGNNGNNED